MNLGTYTKRIGWLHRFLVQIYRTCRNIQWFVRSRALRFIPLRLSAGSTQVKIRPEGWVARVQYLKGYESAELTFVAASLKPGDTFVDAGANVGIFSMIAAAMVGPDGTVLAFEPGGRARSLLEKNVRLNGFDQIKVDSAGLSNHPATRIMRANLQYPHSEAHRFVSTETGDDARTQADDSETVTLKTLDDVIAKPGGPYPSFIKIDVEGHEREVIEGAAETLRNGGDMTLLFEIKKEHKTVYDMLEPLGFQFYELDSAGDRPVPLDLAAAEGEYNVIAIRKATPAESAS